MDHARFGGRFLHTVLDVRTGHDALTALDTGGQWAVVWTFEGEITAVRFKAHEVGTPSSREVGRSPDDWWVPVCGWASSMDRESYLAAVTRVRELIASGEVYQVNVCRVMSAPLAAGADLDELGDLIAAGNPAPYAGRIRCEAAGLDVVCASPELFLEQRDGRWTTGPIKGTAAAGELMLAKDHTENVMIVDLMRNDLSRICIPGSVRVDALCALEHHPGLAHLVSRVSGRAREDIGWGEVFAALSPAGSVSGAPKSSALRAIGELEPTDRGPYCGAVGWVDSDRRRARLAVGIRTFWATGTGSGRRLHFGTGAGITWDSDPQGEWEETELKAKRLVALAS